MHRAYYFTSCFCSFFLMPVFLNIILTTKYAYQFDSIFYLVHIFWTGFVSQNADFGQQVLKNFEIISKVKP